MNLKGNPFCVHLNCSDQTGCFSFRQRRTGKEPIQQSIVNDFIKINGGKIE